MSSLLPPFSRLFERFQCRGNGFALGSRQSEQEKRGRAKGRKSKKLPLKLARFGMSCILRAMIGDKSPQGHISATSPPRTSWTRSVSCEGSECCVSWIFFDCRSKLVGWWCLLAQRTASLEATPDLSHPVGRTPDAMNFGHRMNQATQGYTYSPSQLEDVRDASNRPALVLALACWP
ncbi:hypothetical protein LIA77_04077 [Sarocladium implicatum]|nr:hypothetical protein LIA77_04077 [Sarocladium implicatum]